MIGPHPFHAVGEKYIAAVVQAADCLPLLIPVLETPLDVTEILARVDGIFFPGSPSNVEPRALRWTRERARHAARSASRRDHAVADPARGRERRAGVRRVPRIPGDERRDGRHAAPARARGRRASTTIARTRSSRSTCSTAPAHDVVLEPGGLLRKLAGTDRIRVNSLHWQGVDRLGPGSRRRGARARRAGRGVSREVGAGFRARGAVAPRVAGDEQSVFAGAVRRVRQGARRREDREE